MKDQCLQYKKDFEKLLELKREFDVLLEEGEVKKDLSEVKRIKNELVVSIDNLAKRVGWEYKTREQLRVMFAVEDEEKIEKYIQGKCVINNKDKTVLIKNYLDHTNRHLEFIPENLIVDRDVHLEATDLKRIGNLTAGGIIWCPVSKVEEITGNISCQDFYCEQTPLRSIKGNIKAKEVDLSGTLNLIEILGRIECYSLDLRHTGLKKLPENCKIENIYISPDNKELYESALERWKEAKIVNIYHNS